MSPFLHLLLLASPALQAAGTGKVAFFQGPPGGTGDVQLVDEAGAASPASVAGLLGIELLDIDFSGRADVLDLLPDRPRRRTDVPGASRLRLPAGFGSLYRHARPDGGAGRIHGFFLIDGAGGARVILERTGTGPAGDADPFVDRIAVAPTGDAILVATTLAAGGDLLEVDLSSGAVTARTAELSPREFGGAGLFLHDDWGAAASSAGLLRFDRGGVQDARPVPQLHGSGPAPTWFATEIAPSRNGSHAATIAGAGPTQAHPWVFSSDGPLRRVGDAPASLSGAGFAPDADGGPFLAVSDDGSLCAWRVEDVASRELFLGRVQSAPGEVPIQLTSDLHFVDTGTEVGPIPFFIANTLLMSFGEPGGPGGSPIESMELFQASLSPGSGDPVFVNLSLTSGDTQAPFLTGTLSPARMVWVPWAGAFLIHDEQSGGSGQVIVVEPDQQGPARVLIDQVRELDLVEDVGAHALIGVRRAFDPRPRELHRVPIDLLGPSELLLSALGSDENVRWARRPDGRMLVLFPDPVGPAEFVWRVNPNNGNVSLFTPRPLRYGRTLGFAPGGDALLMVGIPGLPSWSIAWPGIGPLRRLLPGRYQGFLLPGAG